MSEEEFFERAINRICKDYDYNFANELKNIYFKKDKELQQKENIIKEVREYIMSNLITEWDIKNNGYVSGSDLPADAITPILEILGSDVK